jgi:ubiquitin carboxyl-terminal hydrolase 7
MVTAVAKHLDVDPTYLQFFKAQAYRDAPGPALRCTFDGTVKDLLVFCRPKVPKRMFYQQLTIPIHELENKKQMKCFYLSPEQVTKHILFSMTEISKKYI